MTGILTPEYVFISYSHFDQVIALQVKKDLEAAGIKTWIDEQLEPGTPIWERAIRNAVADAFVVILIASPRAKEGPYVQAELQLAASREREIVPVWIEGNHWIDCVPMSLSGTQYIDCRGTQYTAGITQLAKKLQQTIDARSPAMHLLTDDEIRDYRKIIDVDTLYDTDITSLRQDYIYIELSDDTIVAMRYGAYTSVGELLDALYMKYLRTRYVPYAYGNQWLLGTRDDDDGTLIQLLAPWEWLLLGKGSSIVEIQSDWSNFLPRTWFASPRLRNVRVLDKLPQIAYGIVGNLAAEYISVGKRGYVFQRELRYMINRRPQAGDHWLGHLRITMIDRPEEVDPHDYQHNFIVTFDEEGDQRNYVQPGEVDRRVFVVQE